MNRSLKISMGVTSLVLILATVIAWQDHRRLVSARERNAEAVSGAAALGISVGSGGTNGPVLVTKRDRQAGDARREVDEVMAMLHAAEVGEKEGKDMGREFERILNRFLALSPAGLERAVLALIDEKGIDEGNRGALMGFILTKLAEDSPQALLKILPRLPVFPGAEAEDARVRDMFASNALENWAKADPDAAAAWIGARREQFSGSFGEGVKQRVIAGAASKDSARAFELVNEMGVTNQERAVMNITRAAKGEEGRTAALAALRAHLPVFGGVEKEKMLDKGIGELAARSFRQGFGPASEWLGSAGLSPAEMTAAGSGLEYYHTIGETGQWLDWLGQNLPADSSGETVGRIMGRWTEVDYQAAGKWLAAATEGPARDASIQA